MHSSTSHLSRHALGALLISLFCAAANAQTATAPGVTPNPTPDRAGPNAVDCGKAANKRLPDCSTDAGANRQTPPASSGITDRGIQQPEPPRTNNGMSGPMSAPRSPSDVVEGKKDTTSVPR